MATARTREWTLWVVAASAALHATEELATGWLDWAPTALGIDLPASVFVVMNVILVGIALALAKSGWRNPAAALVIPTATLANGLLFHVIPTLIQRRVAPGIYTAVLLYLPFSTWALIGAARDGVPRRSLAIGVAGGVLMAVGVVAVARSATRAF